MKLADKPSSPAHLYDLAAQRGSGSDSECDSPLNHSDVSADPKSCKASRGCTQRLGLLLFSTVFVGLLSVGAGVVWGRFTTGTVDEAGKTVFYSFNEHRLDSNYGAADTLCHNQDRPRVAYCIAGEAAALANPLVYKTMRTNMMEAYGGDFMSFFYLRVKEHLSDDANELSEVFDALQHLQADMVTFDDRQYTLGELVNPSCSFMLSYGPKARMEGIQQLRDWDQCYRMVEAEELASGIKYDTIIKLRPDLFTLYGMKPHCLMDKDEIVMGGKTEGIDDSWFVMLPRQHAHLVFGLFQRYRECTGFWRLVSHMPGIQGVMVASIEQSGGSVPMRHEPHVSALVLSAHPSEEDLSDLCHRYTQGFNCEHGKCYDAFYSKENCLKTLSRAVP